MAHISFETYLELYTERNMNAIKFVVFIRFFLDLSKYTLKQKHAYKI